MARFSFTVLAVLLFLVLPVAAQNQKDKIDRMSIARR